MTFAELLRTTRERKGYTLGSVYRDSGVSVSFLCDIEHGRRLPSAELARRIARALGADEFDFQVALAIDRGTIDFDPEAVPVDAVRRAITEIRAGGAR